MTPPHAAGDDPSSDTDLAALQDLLDALPAAIEPLDPMAIDGFLCGVLLQPRSLTREQWLPFAIDVEGRPAPAGAVLDRLHAVLLRRHAELDAAIGARLWIDPWVFELEEDAAPAQVVLPWVAGFAAAMLLFPALMAANDPELVEPLALLFRHFDPDDLEDADALLEVIETLEPAVDLAEAVEDLVRSVMLIADVTRPLPRVQRPQRARKRPARRS